MRLAYRKPVWNATFFSGGSEFLVHDGGGKGGGMKIFFKTGGRELFFLVLFSNESLLTAR